jgi:hypothetical protein
MITLLWIYLLYLHFLAYVAIYAAKKSGTLDQLPVPAKALAYFILICAYGIDVAFNMIIGTLIFLELPYTWTFTARCELYMYDDNWRGKLARWICKWLNPIQTGHCH